jgi:hypothetical protein
MKRVFWGVALILIGSLFGVTLIGVAQAGQPIEYQVADRTFVGDGSTRQVFANAICSANSSPVGGGFELSHHPDLNFVPLWNYPHNNGWDVGFFVQIPVGVEVTIRTWVACI